MTSLLSFVQAIARLTHDRETLAGISEPFLMDKEDAVVTLSRLIVEARTLLRDHAPTLILVSGGVVTDVINQDGTVPSHEIVDLDDLQDCSGRADTACAQDERPEDRAAHAEIRKRYQQYLAARALCPPAALSITSAQPASTRFLDSRTGSVTLSEAAHVGPDGSSPYITITAVHRDMTDRIAADHFDVEPEQLTGSWWLIYLNGHPSWILEEIAPAPTLDGESYPYGFVHCNELPVFRTLDEAIDAIARAAFYLEYHATLGFERPTTWMPSRDYRSIITTPQEHAP